MGRNKHKSFNVIHYVGGVPDTGYRFILLPRGVPYHKDVESAKPGDKVKFLDGTIKVVRDISKVRIYTSVFRNMCRMRYGRETEIVVNQWRRTAISLGYAVTTIDNDVATVIWYKD